MHPYREHLSPPTRAIDPDAWDNVYIKSHKHPWKGGPCASCYAWMDDIDLIDTIDIVQCPECKTKWNVFEIDVWFGGCGLQPKEL